MKKSLLIVLLFSISWVFGQNLTLSELVTIRKMSITENKTFLKNKGWHYNNFDEENNDQQGKYVFYLTDLNSNPKRKLILTRTYESNKDDIIELTFCGQSKFNDYIKEAKLLNAELDSTLEERATVTLVYLGGNTVYTFKIITFTEEGKTLNSFKVNVKSMSTYFREKYNY